MEYYDDETWEKLHPELVIKGGARGVGEVQGDGVSIDCEWQIRTRRQEGEG